MDGVQRRRSLWKNLKRRLRFKGSMIMGFCGSSNWVLSVTDITDTEHQQPQDDDVAEPLITAAGQFPAALHIPEFCIGQVPAGDVMNLATALAAERIVGEKPLKSLMRLFEEIDGGDLEKHDGDGGIGTLCCLCTEKNKGAALIPCGHTYCRACSRDLWLNQRSCPLCNGSIIEILDIF